jgi:hypothetical protein
LQVDPVVAGGFKDHARRRFAVLALHFRGIRAEVGGIDQIRANQLERSIVHRDVLLMRHPAPANRALVGNDYIPKSRLLQPAQRLDRPGERANKVGIFAIVHVFNQRAITVQENCGCIGHEIPTLTSRSVSKRGM